MTDARIFVFTGLSALAACSGGGEGSGSGAAPPPGFGEPVGITLAGVPNVGDVEIRMALTKGREAKPLIKPIAQAVLKGLGACPGFVEAGKKGAVPSLSFHVEGGKVASGVSDDATAKCVLDSMQGAAVGEASDAPLDALAIVRFGPFEGN